MLFLRRNSTFRSTATVVLKSAQNLDQQLDIQEYMKRLPSMHQAHLVSYSEFNLPIHNAQPIQWGFFTWRRLVFLILLVEKHFISFTGSLRKQRCRSLQKKKLRMD